MAAGMEEDRTGWWRTHVDLDLDSFPCAVSRVMTARVPFL